MKNLIKLSFIAIFFAIVTSSCEKENEEDELKIEFKTDMGYTYSDMILESGTTIMIGIEAETEKARDPLVRFDVSESINEGASTSVYNESFNSKEYEHDFEYVLTDSISGNTHDFTFTITNKDGIIKQEELRITVL